MGNYIYKIWSEYKNESIIYSSIKQDTLPYEFN